MYEGGTSEVEAGSWYGASEDGRSVEEKRVLHMATARDALTTWCEPGRPVDLER
jgi:hypothetical protein